MNEQGHFEIARAESVWFWRLVDGEVTIAVSPERYEDSGEAREAVDRVRDAAAYLQSLTTEEFDYLTNEFEYPAAPGSSRPRLRVESGGERERFSWRLEWRGQTLATPNFSYGERGHAVAALKRFQRLAAGAIPIHLIGAEDETPYDPFEVGMSAVRGAFSTLLSRGRRHRRFLQNIDHRIVVSGIRGKSSTAKRLDDVFNRRGYDTLTKITGNHPHLIHNGSVIPIDRKGPHTTLYENIRVMEEFVPRMGQYTPDDVAIFENQGITEYTTRLINRQFVDPDVVVIANVRQDHQDTLAKEVRDIARVFARTVPSGATVVNGEQNPVLAEYMREEIAQQGAEMVSVFIPEDQQGRIGAETVYAVNDVLRVLKMDPVPEPQLNAYLDAIQPRWVQLPGGRIFNGAEINDIESTEAIRQALAGDSQVLPFVYLRADRRSRTASFAKYLNTLAERDLIDRARAGGAFTSVFASKVDVPVIKHDREEDASEVLTEMLEEGDPVLTMGNTVDDFMRDLEAEISERAQQAAIEIAD